ncbi:hypothetical protein CL633_00730 [bacterium]|nr:hypothetical protein [bacterium]|tara:strand:- start:951 stop:1202 length:252 start_codon:yes stop_codon:yes gene_type:complete
MVNAQTQITFKAPLALKNKALAKIRREGITLKALLIMAIREYINDNLLVSLRPAENYFDKAFEDKKITAKANKLGELLQNKTL